MSGAAMTVPNRGEDGMKRPGFGGGASRLVVDKRPRMPVGRARLDHLSGRSSFGDGIEHAAERSGDGVVSAGPPQRLGEDVVGSGCDLAVRTGAAVVERGAAVGVLEHAAAAVTVAVAPDEQRVDDRPEVLAGLGELVEVPAAVVGVGEPFDDAVGRAC